MLQVGVNGYGTIGKRVADAITAQPDMELAGVAKTRPNFEAEQAVKNGYPLFAAVPERVPRFEEAGIDLAGEVEALVDRSDVVVDATPSGIGAENKELYDAHGTPALYQGGEDAELVDASFNARSNFSEAVGRDHVRVVSCNTTGLSRLVAPIEETFGIEKVMRRSSAVAATRPRAAGGRSTTYCRTRSRFLHITARTSRRSFPTSRSTPSGSRCPRRSPTLTASTSRSRARRAPPRSVRP